MLHQINLLPWRAQQRNRQQQRLVWFICMSLIGAFVVQWYVGAYLTQQIEQQQARQHYLASYSAQLERQLALLNTQQQQRTQLLTHLTAINAINLRRSSMTLVMNLLATALPARVYLERVTLQDLQLELHGFADSSEQIAQMIETLQRAPWVSEVKMHSLTQGEARLSHHYSSYHISVRLTRARE